VKYNCFAHLSVLVDDIFVNNSKSIMVPLIMLDEVIIGCLGVCFPVIGS